MIEFFGKMLALAAMLMILLLIGSMIEGKLPVPVVVGFLGFLLSCLAAAGGYL